MRVMQRIAPLAIYAFPATFIEPQLINQKRRKLSGTLRNSLIFKTQPYHFIIIRNAQKRNPISDHPKPLLLSLGHLKIHPRVIKRDHCHHLAGQCATQDQVSTGDVGVAGRSSV